jgi:hypothetical protein
VIIVVIASNIVLGSYEMNKSNWEKMNEGITILIYSSSHQLASGSYTVKVIAERETKRFMLWKFDL